MKVVIAGSRGISGVIGRLSLIKAIEQSSFFITEVVSGGAIGVDKLGEAWAMANDVNVTQFLPQYDLFPPKVAPIKRNEKMADYADAALFLWDGVSRGTFNMIKNMHDRNKLYFIRMVF